MVLVNLLALCGGIIVGWTSPILPKLTNPNRTDENPIGHVITENEESWITAILYLGPLIAAYPWGVLADRYGRKHTLTLIGLPILLAFFILAVATHVVWFLIARFMCGFAYAGVISVLFVYIGEISDVENRGKLLSFYSNFFTFGLLFSYVLGVYMSVLVFNFVAAVVPAVFLSYFTVFAVESPVFLLKANRRNEAFVVLKKLRVGSDKSVQVELDALQKEVETTEQGTIKDVLSDRALIKGLTISVALVVFQQLSGIAAVLSYAESIFEDTGSSLSTEVSAIIVGAVQFLSSFVTPIFVDCAGRKTLLLFSSVGMIITEVALGAYFYISTNTNTDSISWLPIPLLITFIIVYNSAYGVLPYTIMGEIFPSKTRSVAAATTSLMNSVSGFLVSLLFRKLQGWIGNAGTFWLFGGFCVLALIFVALVVPETKGKSLEQIHKELRK